MLGWFKPKTAKTLPDLEALGRIVKAGFEAHSAGREADARAAYEKVLHEVPDHADANYLLGLLDMASGQLESAVTRFDRAIRAGGANGSFHFSRGEALRALNRLQDATREFEAALRVADPDSGWAVELGRTHEALGDRVAAMRAYERAVEIDRSAVSAWCNIGSLHLLAGRLDEAESAFRTALDVAPGFVPARIGMAELLRKQGRGEASRQIYEAVLDEGEGHVGAAINLAAQFVERKQFDQAERVVRAALERFEAPPDLWLNLGAALIGQRRWEEAREALEKAIALDPGQWRSRMQLAVVHDHCGELDAAEAQLYEAVALAEEEPEVHFILAGVLRRQGALSEAEAEYRRAIALRPDFGAAWINYADLLQRTSRIQAAAGALEHALKAAPEMPEAHLNRGVVQMHLGNLDEAEASLLKALELRKDFIDAWVSLAVVYLMAAKLRESEHACRSALAFAPDDLGALVNLGICLQQQGKLDESVAVTRRVIALKPDYPQAWSNLLLNQNYSARIDAAALFEEHRRFGLQFLPRRDRAFFRDRRPAAGRKLRIGYVSPDFRFHVVSMFFEAVLDAHDRDAFEIICYHCDNRVDTVTDRLRESADLWRDLAPKKDDEAEAIMLADALDVVVDLAGHTASNRLALLSRRVAPVQVTWLGYPNTTGLPSMDWRITDERADPPAIADAVHVEKLWRMPDVFLAYRPRAEAPDVGPVPSIANGHVTFGSFNNFAKISDDVVALWGRILAALPDARLVMKTMSLKDPDVQQSIRERLARLGCDVDRVTLSGMIPGLRNHLASLSNVDIALDAYPYHGTTTTCECLWMGVPVISLAGDRHASRVGVSLLETVGAGDLVATSPDDYVAKAIALSRDRPALEFWRRELRPRMQASPLTDPVRFTRHLEQAYRQMFDEWRATC